MIALLRVDGRLLHGQVRSAWVPALQAEGIIALDEESAASVLMRSALRAAFPPSLQVEVLAPEGVDWGELASSPQRWLLVAKDLRTAEEAVELADAAGATIPAINLGNLAGNDESRTITPSVRLGAADLMALRRLAARGLTVEARVLPTSPALSLEEIEARYSEGVRGA